MNIKDINNFEDLNLRQTFRSHIIYEQIMGETFSARHGLNGIIMFFYSNVVACNPDMECDYDVFMDWLDDHPEMVSRFSDWYISVNKVSVTEEGEPSKKA